MLTGDSLNTAKAIALECGILERESEEYEREEEEESGKVVEGEMSGGTKKKKTKKQIERKSAMTGAEFDERIHVLEESGGFVTRRRYDLVQNTESFGEAKPFLLDRAGRKVVNRAEFAKVARDLRVLVGFSPLSW